MEMKENHRNKRNQIIYMKNIEIKMKEKKNQKKLRKKTESQKKTKLKWIKIFNEN